MRMLKCDPRAFARCPYRKQCSDSPEHTSFYVGTECDDFNRNILEAPMTNADKIRAMSDEELTEWLCQSLECNFCKAHMQNIPARSRCENHARGILKWLQQPAEEEA